MKKITLLLGFLCTLFVLSCSKSDDGTQKAGTDKYDGKYKGYAYFDNQIIGSWEMDILKGNISGTYTQATESASLSGSVSESGKMNLMVNYEDGTEITIAASIENGQITGTWSDGEGRNGTLSGTKEGGGSVTPSHNGTYTGSATANGVEIATWDLAVVENKISGSFNDANSTAFIMGEINSKGDAQVDILYEDGAKAQATLKFEDNKVSGTWSADGNSGEISGDKQNDQASHNYDGHYEGQVYKSGNLAGTWTMDIANNIVAGAYSGDGEGGTVEGMVAADGKVFFNAYVEDDFVLNVKATISGTTVNGTWKNNEGDSGTFSGEKK